MPDTTSLWRQVINAHLLDAEAALWAAFYTCPSVSLERVRVKRAIKYVQAARDECKRTGAADA